MHTVTIIKCQGTTTTRLLEEAFTTEIEALEKAKKFIEAESMKRSIPLKIDFGYKTRLNEDTKLYNVLDDTPCHYNSLIGNGSLMYLIVLDDPNDHRKFNIKRAHLGVHAGF